MHTNHLRVVISTLALFVLAGCGRDGGQQAGDKATGTPESAMPREKPMSEDATEMTRSPAPGDARVYFITPADGDVVSSPLTVEFGLAGMKVAPAGTQAPDSGHHHLLIDTDLPDLDAPIPADPQHVHFGDGSTSTELTLSPGEHTLQLLFADYRHVPHDPAVYSEPITITVK